MINLHLAGERTALKVGWLDCFSTFAYNPFVEPDHNRCSDLVKLEEEILRPGGGFGDHPHSQLEMFIYVVSGFLLHRDSLGNNRLLGPGDVQLMSAGSGLVHSTHNPTPDAEARTIQFWLEPGDKGGRPNCSVLNVTRFDGLNQLRLVASPTGEQGSLLVRQDAWVYLSHLEKDSTLCRRPPSGGRVFIHLVNGGLAVNDVLLNPGDSVSIEQEQHLVLTGTGPGEAELLLWELRDR